jgi:hypothetical protein
VDVAEAERLVKGLLDAHHAVIGSLLTGSAPVGSAKANHLREQQQALYVRVIKAMTDDD